MYPDRQQLLDSIHPGMKLHRPFFLKIYADEITWPGFADEAIRKLEKSGCSKAREYYNNTVAEYQRKRDEELRPVVRQIRKEWEAEWEKRQKEGDRQRKREIMKDLHQKSDRELLNLLQTLK